MSATDSNRVAQRVSIQHAIGQHADRIQVFRDTYSHDAHTTTGGRLSLLLVRVGAIAESTDDPSPEAETIETGLLRLGAEVQLWLEHLSEEAAR